MAMPVGFVPAAMVGVPRAVRAPVPVLRLYIDMVAELILTTYTEVPSAEIVMPAGFVVAMVGVPRAVRAPVPVPPSAKQLVVGAAVVPQQVPLTVILKPPLEVTLAPRVAPVEVMEVTVGVVTVGEAA